MPAIQTVYELTAEIKGVIESHFGQVSVMGEISNFKRSSNGHLYLTVKDSRAQLPSVMWRGSAFSLGFEPEDGMKVVIHGALQIYAPHGRYQMIIDRMEQQGIGELQIAFERLKKKLHAEGLFDAAAKKPLPAYPMRIGVITSSTGAAFHDIRSTLEKRWPVAELVLLHSAVQGVDAARQLEEGIQFFSEGGEEVDVLIVGRGGGSLEDLWPFNEERVARAIYACRVPVISAVGHEIDVSISDYVADQSAATPTQAAVAATPDIQELRYQMDDIARHVQESMKRRLDRLKERVERHAGSHALMKVQGVIQMRRSVVDQLRFRLTQGHRDRFAASSQALVMLQHKLERVNPKEPLRRGFSRVIQDGTWVRKREGLDPGRSFEIEWADGRAKMGPEQGASD